MKKIPNPKLWKAICNLQIYIYILYQNLHFLQIQPSILGVKNKFPY
jgi:hypothetical protein